VTVKYVIGIIEYLLGFLALSVFSFLAFRGGAPTDATWRTAFMVSGAVAFVTKQWWILQVYERWQAAGLVACMLGAGLVATVTSQAGFVAVEGERWKVLASSLLLITATGGLLGYMLVATGPIHKVLVAPLTALALLARALRMWVARVSQHS
jgi:hypothetical protein